MNSEYLTVSEITRELKGVINPNFRHVFVRGELSNAKLWRSGHFYFTLKDENSQIKGVMFSASSRLKFKPKDGMKVLIEGKIEVYDKNGYYQLYVSKISEDGVGELYRAYEQLKEKLSKEGLFDENHKKKIPNFPKKIGVVTAANGAAIRDIITTIERRWPLCEVILFPSLVQGQLAAYQIADQIKKSENYDLDTLIVGRGGGSIEDLWCFNEEIVARAIYDCTTPVISAVGHEIDFTIADFVADLRAPTPTAAAELAVPPFKEIKAAISQLNSRSYRAIDNIFKVNKQKFDYIVNKNLFKNPLEMYQPKEIILDNLINRLEISSKSLIKENMNKLKLIKNTYVLKNPDNLIDRYHEKYLMQINKLELLNPLHTLKRGYSLARSEGKIISSADDLKSGDELEVEFKDGSVNTKVI